ncbi:MAG: hypothetical protein PHC61_06745 [Chitinivibrionales bacterium]|nr:hypothetical protein [Chitinivibrionales bacterium]
MPAKIGSLAMLGRCMEMQQLKDSVLTGFNIPKPNLNNRDNPSSVNPELQSRQNNLNAIMQTKCGSFKVAP